MKEAKIHSLSTFVQHTYWNKYPDQLGKRNKICHPNLKGRTKTISTEDITENRKDRHTHMHTQRTKINLVKLQDTKINIQKPVAFFDATTNYPKRKLRKQFHSQYNKNNKVF